MAKAPTTTVIDETTHNAQLAELRAQIVGLTESLAAVDNARVELEERVELLETANAEMAKALAAGGSAVQTDSMGLPKVA